MVSESMIWFGIILFSGVDINEMFTDGWERSEICEMLKEKFGEKNPDVKV
jgi:hypothetical protein